MKRRIASVLLLVSIALGGCTKRNPVDQAFGDLIAKLDGQGFYRYTMVLKKGHAKSEALKYHYLYGEDTGRAYVSDAEDLAEGGIVKFLDDVRPFLEKQGAGQFHASEEIAPNRYVVTLDGQAYLIYDEQGMQGDFWTLSSDQAINLLNLLLEKAKSHERAYALYGGNDLQVVFLTPEMYKTIIDSHVQEASENPMESQVSLVKLP